MNYRRHIAALIALLFWAILIVRPESANAGAAPTIVQTNNANPCSSSTGSATCSLTTAATNTSHMLAFFVGQYAGTVTAPSGASLLVSASASAQTNGIFSQVYLMPVTSSSGNSFTFSNTAGNQLSVGIMEIAGSSPTSISGVVTDYTGTAALTTSALTPQVANTLPVAFFDIKYPATETPNASWTEKIANNAQTRHNIEIQSHTATTDTSTKLSGSIFLSGSTPLASIFIEFGPSDFTGNTGPISAGYNTETPIRANDFVDTIGINTHMTLNGWTEGKNPNGLNAALFTLGIRHVRDYSTANYDNLLNLTFWNALNANSAIGLDNIFFLGYGDHSAVIAELATKNKAIESIEAPNETNPGTKSSHWSDECPSPNTVYTCWPEDTSHATQYYGPVAHTSNLKVLAGSVLYNTTGGYTCTHDATTTDSSGNVTPTLNRLPTSLCPTDGMQDLNVMQLQSNTNATPDNQIFDFCNMHPYAGGLNPGWSGLASNINAEVVYAGSQPCVVTEVGYSSVDDNNNDVMDSEYEPRIFLEDYIEGVPLTYQFNSVDEPWHSQDLHPPAGEYFSYFGLLSIGGYGTPDTTNWVLTPKPQYEALRNMIALFNDTGPAYTVSPVTYRIDTSASSVHHLLLANRDGSYWLALWNEIQAVTIANQNGHACASETSQTATLNFASPQFSSAGVSTMVAETGQFINKSSLTAGTNQYGTSFGPFVVTGCVSFYRLSTNQVTLATPLPTATPFPLNAATPGPYQTSTPPANAPPPVPVTLASSTLSFASPTSAAQTDTISDGSYSGNFSVTSSAAGIVKATIAAGSHILTVTPIAGGQTVLTVSDGTTSAKVTVTVTAAVPVSVSLASLQFTSPTAAAQTVTISDGSYTGPFSISVSVAGVVSVPTSVSGTTLSVSPAGSGQTVITVSDGTTSATIQVGVTAAPATVPVTVSPTSLQFTSPTAAAQNVTISDGSYSGSFSISSSTSGVVTVPSSISGHTLAVTPVAAGQTTLSISDGTTTANVSIGVTAANAPPPAPFLVQPCATAHKALNASTSETAVLASPAAAGDTVTAAYAAANPSGQAITPPSGQTWTLISQPFQGIWELLSVYSATIGTPQQSFTFTQSIPSSSSLTVCEFANTPYIASASNAANASAIQTADLTPPGISALPVAFFGMDRFPIVVQPQASIWSQHKYVGTPFRQSLQTQIGQITKTTPVHGLLTTGSTANMAAVTLLLAGNVAAQPMPTYTNLSPGQTYPLGITGVPQATGMTISAEIRCNASTTGAGQTIVSFPGAWYLEAGLCDGNANAATGSTGAHFYVSGTGQQALPGTGLTSGATYTIVGTSDPTGGLAYYVCPLAQACVQYTNTTTPGNVTYNGTAAIIGASDGGARPFQGDIWNVQYYSSALSQAQVQTLASASFADTYPTTHATGPTDLRTNNVSDTITSLTVTHAALPSIVYSNAQPGQSYPYTVTGLPQPPNMTIMAQIKCNSTSSGSTIFGYPGAFDLEAGTCSGSGNAATSAGAHIYNVGSGAQAVAGSGLTFGTVYTIAATEDGSNLNYYVCPFPASAGNCTKTSTASTSLTYTGTTGYIGGADSQTRIFSGDIWNVAFYNGALNDQQIQNAANAGVADPYSALTLSPTSLSFALGTSNAQTVTITDAAYTGNYTSASSPSGVVSTSINQSTDTLTVTPQAAGTATVTVSESNGAFKTVSVTVGSSSSVFSTTYSDQNLPPVGWRPVSYCGQIDTTCSIATDFAHINWPAVCAKNLISCSNGDPPLSGGSYSSTSIINATWSAPVLDLCDSAAYEATSGGVQGASQCQSSYAPYDYGYSVFFGAVSSGATVPNTTLYGHTLKNYPACTAGYNECGPGGTSMYLPYYALAQFGGDGHMYIMDETHHKEGECWNHASPQSYIGTSDPVACGTYSVGPLDSNQENIAFNPFTGTAANTEQVGLLLRPEELIAAQTNPATAVKHALAISVGGNRDAHIYPAGHNDGCPSGGGGSGVEGSFYYLDTAGYNAVLASNESPYYKAIMASAHNYGWMDDDSGNCGDVFINFEVWGSGGYVAANMAASGGVPGTSNAIVNPWDTIYATMSSSVGNFKVDAHTAGAFGSHLSLPSSGYDQSHWHVINFACVYYLMQGGTSTSSTLGQSCPHP